MTESRKYTLNDRINVAITDGSITARDEVDYIYSCEILNSVWSGTLPAFMDGIVSRHFMRRAQKKQRRMDKFRKLSQRFLMA